MSHVETKLRSKRRPRTTVMRFRKGDSSHNLLAASQRWLRDNGGDALVIGGIGIIEADAHSFYIAVKVTGRRPQRSENTQQAQPE